MNIKFLKFLVLFMGILIIAGIVVLCIGLYYKFNALDSKNSKPDKISIKIPKDLDIKDYYINNDNIVITYENNNDRFIYIYDIVEGNIIKKIELLK